MKKAHIVLLMFVVYVIGVTAFSYYRYVKESANLMESIERQLGWAAAGTALLLGEDYHHKYLGKKNLDEKSYLEYARKITAFSDKMKTDYVYSFIKREDKVYFTSTSYKENEWENAYNKDFLAEYEDATDILKRAFVSRKIVFETSKDKWGHFRSILMPLEASDGTVYVVGADLDISFIEGKLNEVIIEGVTVSIYFLFLLLPIGFLYYRILRKDNEILEQKVEERTAELNNANGVLHDLSNKLSKYLSPQIKEMLFTGKGDATIRSTRKKLTVYFSDIKDFTGTTAHMEPEELTNLLNGYFDAMNKIAFKYGATIDKYIGDAIVIFVGDPESKGEKEDAFACVAMAIEMRKTMHELQIKWLKEGISSPFHIRSGINTGYVTVGNFGSEQKMDYTIIGSQVNIAARLESLCAADEILISHETYSLIKERVNCAPRDEVTIKGIDWPIKTYQVIDLLENTEQTIYDIDQDGVSLFVNLKKVPHHCLEGVKQRVEEIDRLLGNSEK